MIDQSYVVKSLREGLKMEKYRIFWNWLNWKYWLNLFHMGKSILESKYRQKGSGANLIILYEHIYKVLVYRIY